MSSLVQSAKSMFLISIKTSGVKWWFLLKCVWSASKEVTEVYGKKHSCLLLEMHVSPVKALGSERTLWLAHEWPHYPGSWAHPLTLHSNPPPAWPLLSCLLLKTHLSQLPPLDNNQAPGFCQGWKNDCSSCLKIYCFFRCCCLFRQSDIMLKVHSSCGLDRAMFGKWCVWHSIHLTSWALTQLLKREWMHTQEHHTDMVGPKSCLLVALLRVFSKHRPISDSLCSAVIPHTPRHPPHIRTSV